MIRSSVNPITCPTCGGEDVPCVFCAVRKSHNSEVCNIELVPVSDLAAISVGIGTARKASFDYELKRDLLSQRWGLSSPSERYREQEIDKAVGEVKEKYPCRIRQQRERNARRQGRPKPNEAQRQWGGSLPALPAID